MEVKNKIIVLKKNYNEKIMTCYENISEMIEAFNQPLWSLYSLQ